MQNKHVDANIIVLKFVIKTHQWHYVLCSVMIFLVLSSGFFYTYNDTQNLPMVLTCCDPNQQIYSLFHWVKCHYWVVCNVTLMCLMVLLIALYLQWYWRVVVTTSLMFQRHFAFLGAFLARPWTWILVLCEVHNSKNKDGSGTNSWTRKKQDTAHEKPTYNILLLFSCRGQ